MANAQAQSASKDTPLQQLTMGMAKEMILLNMFRRFQGTRPDMEARLQAAYKEKYKRPMRASTSGRDVRAMYLEGEPGHGKTTTHREACKEFARLVGLKFIEDPSLSMMMNDKINDDCFVFTTLTVAGATSKHEVGGLMAKTKVGDQEFMGHLPDWRMAAAMQGAFGYVLFDDFVTASHQVQNACLDLLLGGSAGDFQFNMKEVAASKVTVKGGQVTLDLSSEKLEAIEKLTPNYRGASPVHLGLAGNRGARDGNKTFPITTATATRVQRADVRDTVEDFISRAQARYPDAVGDAQYSTFMKMHPELFSAIAKPMQGILPSSPCPRTHDALMDDIGVLVHNAGGFGAIASDKQLRESFIDDVERTAGTHIGREIEIIDPDSGKKKTEYPATKVAGFYNEMLLGAMPRAEEIIHKGEVNEEFIKTKYNDGQDADGVNFGYQFASALASLAATVVGEKIQALGNNPLDKFADVNGAVSMDVRKSLMHFSYGLCFVKPLLVSYALDKFVSRLNTICPEVFEGSGNYRMPHEKLIPTLVFGLVPDNKKYPVQDVKATLADSLSQASNGYLNGLDKTMEAEIGKRKDALAAARKAHQGLK